MRLASFVATWVSPPVPTVAAEAIHLGQTVAVSPLEQHATEGEAPAPRLSIEEFVHRARLAGAL